MRRIPGILCFFNEPLPAFGAGYGDLALVTGHPDGLAAFGALKIPMVPVLQPVLKGKKFAVFLIPQIFIPGHTADDGPDHQTVGDGGEDQIHRQIPNEHGDQADHHTGTQQEHIEPVVAITPIHKSAQTLSDFAHNNDHPLLIDSIILYFSVFSTPEQEYSRIVFIS